ncbi:MAG: hypothetical protein JSY10_15815 [Paenibacillus sp.]|nr:hypothetical protein [Paenibacillus sp.]
MHPISPAQLRNHRLTAAALPAQADSLPPPASGTAVHSDAVPVRCLH